MHGKPYLYRGSPRLLDQNAAIMAARTPEQHAVTAGHVTYFEWGRHHIRVRKTRAQPLEMFRPPRHATRGPDGGENPLPATSKVQERTR